MGEGGFGLRRSEAMDPAVDGGRHGGRVLPAAAVVVGAGCLAALVAGHPGHFPPDAVWQLAQGRAGVFDDWHPPVMAWLLGLADRVQRGAWPFVLADAALFYGGLFALVALDERPRPACLPVLLLWMVTPVSLITQGVVIKDVLFANAVLAAFAALAWAGRLWASRTARLLLLAIAFGLLGLAALTRQNGFVAPLCGAAALVGVARFAGAPPDSSRSRRRPALAYGVGALLLTLGACEAASLALASHGDHRPQTSAHLAVLEAYDLAGALRREPDFPLAALDRSRPEAARFLRREAAPIWRAAAVDNIVALPDADVATTPDGSALTEDWSSLIRSRPDLYVRERVAVWWMTLSTPLAEGCPMIITGVDSPSPRLLRRAGLTPRDSGKDDWDFDYAAAFLRTPLYSHLFYGAVLLVGLLEAARRWRRGDRRPGLMCAIGLGSAALLVLASYTVIAIACDYRFLYVLDVAAMGVSAHLAASGPMRR